MILYKNTSLLGMNVELRIGWMLGVAVHVDEYWTFDIVIGPLMFSIGRR